MSKENTTEYIVLGLLMHEDLSGYDLKKHIDQSISQFWEVGYGQLYPTLKELEQAGYISGRAETSVKGPARTVYTITETGREYLAQWLRLPAQKEYVKYEILLKVFFGGLLPLAETLNKIDAFDQRVRANAALLGAYRQNLEGVLEEDEAHLYFYLTVLFGERVYQAYCDWAEEAKRLLLEHSEKKSTRG